MKVLKDLKYTKEHEWVRLEGNVAVIGITDFAQGHLGDIVFVELPEVGEEFVEGDGFGVIDSVKATSDVYMPVDGEILEVNSELEDSPELINEDPYENWMIKVKVSDPGQVDDLLNAEEYEQFCKEEEE